MVERVLVTKGRAVGVRFQRPGTLGLKREHHTIYARKEIIMTAGAIATPQILMLSGIGPKHHLQGSQVKFSLGYVNLSSLHLVVRECLTFLGSLCDAVLGPKIIFVTSLVIYVSAVARLVFPDLLGLCFLSRSANI